MAPEERRSGPESGKGDFDGRDLLVGRPEGAEGRAAAGAVGTAQTAASPQPAVQDAAIREILETVRTTAARIDALQEAPSPEDETTEVLVRQTAALTQAVEEARSTLAKAAELAAQQDGRATVAAQALAKSVAALKAQGEALDKRIRATGTQAQANAKQAKENTGQAEATAQGLAEMKEAAAALDSRLRTHAEEVLRAARRQRWRPWLTGLAVGSASFVFFVVGAVLQRETDVVSFGDPRHEWNEHVVEHFAPLLAACATKARLEDKPIGCPLTIYPTRQVAIPFPPDVTLERVPPDEDSDPTAER